MAESISIENSPLLTLRAVAEELIFGVGFAVKFFIIGTLKNREKESNK